MRAGREYEYDKCGTIANFIASALQHPIPLADIISGGPGRPISTIEVSQHKNKFDQVRVYCTLASYNLVSENWALDGGEGHPSPAYRQVCMMHDAHIYRDAYRGMVALVPDLRNMIMSQADFAYLLSDTMKDVDVWIGKITEGANLHENQAKYLARLLDDWGVEDVIQLRENIRKVYHREV